MKNDDTSNLMIGLAKILAALLITVSVSAVASAHSVVTDDVPSSKVARDLDSNFGTNPNLLVLATNTGSPEFKLAPTVPVGTQGSAVPKATLEIYVGNVSTPGAIDFIQAAESWNEKNVTARRAPRLGRCRCHSCRR